MLLLPLLFTATVGFAGIFGVDDREEARSESVPLQLRELSLSVPAIVEKKVLIERDGALFPEGYPLSRMGFCPEIRFFDQSYVARCGSSLVGEDLVLTAGHCIDQDVEKWCREYAVVFDYAVGVGDKRVRKENVYGCKEIVYRQFVGAFDEDLALIRLDRKVRGRKLIRLSQDELRPGERLSMIGYPLGIPQKVVDDGFVIQLGPDKYSFRHNLDTFSSNSGGPIFNSHGEQVGVLVRGTGPNQQRAPGRSCDLWGIDKKTDWAEANSLLHLPLK